MKTSFAAFFLLLVAAPITRAEMPEFAYPQNNAIAFYPTAALHKGDVLQVRSPRLLGDETLVLARCDDGCKDATVISVWRHGFHLATGIYNPLIRSNFTLKRDGRYFFQLVKNSDCYVDAWMCHNARWPGVLHYGNPQPLKIEQAQMQGPLYRVKFDSGTWVLVRRLGMGSRAAN